MHTTRYAEASRELAAISETVRQAQAAANHLSSLLEAWDEMNTEERREAAATAYSCLTGERFS